VESFLHIHPDFSVTAAEGLFVLSAPGARVLIEPFGMISTRVVSGRVEPAQGWYCPEFGRAVAAPVLVCDVAEASHEHFGFRIRPVEGAR
jgi:hypothetical protein